MLARDRPACRNTVFQNIFASPLSALQFPRLTSIEKNDGMQVAVPGVEDIAYGEPMALRNLMDVAQCRCDLGARDHAVLHIIGRTHPANRSKRVLTALPEQVALLRGSRHAKLACATGHAGS